MIYAYEVFMDKFMQELAKHAEKNPRLIWQLAQASTDIESAWLQAENYVDEMLMQMHDVDTAIRFKEAGLLSIENLVLLRHTYFKLEWPQIGK